MIENTNRQLRWYAINILQERVSKSKFWELGIFVVLAIGFTISTILLANLIKYLQTNLLLIEKQPLLIPILANSILVSLYLSVQTSIIASRELDKGTLEMLLYGPVDESAYILSNFLANFKIIILTLLVSLIWSNFCTWILNLSFNINIFGILLASLIMASVLISFGIFTAFWGGKTRNALIYFILILLILGTIQIGDAIISGLVQVQKATVSDPAIMIRNILAALNSVIKWLSPFSLSLNAMQVIVDQNIGEFFIYIGIMLLECVPLLLGAILLLKKRGVRSIV